MHIPPKSRAEGAPHNKEDYMYPYNMQPPFNPREWVEAMKDFEEFQEERDKRRKEKDKSKEQKKQGFTTMEIFLVLTLLSPICGPLYLYAVISAARHIGDMLQQIH